MIKTIVFDFGGVCFKGGTTSALIENLYRLVDYGILDTSKEAIDELFRESCKREAWLCRTGQMSCADYWANVSERLGVDQKMAEKLREIWYSSYTTNDGMEQIVSGLKENENYRLVVFSGNIEDRIKYVDEKYGILDNFDDCLFSFDSGMDKTDGEFYERQLLKAIGCEPGECVYIDDEQRYLDIARPLGINTILFESPSQLADAFRGLGIKTSKEDGWTDRDLNPEPLPCKGSDLPIDLSARKVTHEL